MADPIKSDEIEDVLSSIRRLVTEHQPPTDLADGVEAGPAADKLVLTPALRVTDPDDPWVPIAAQDDPSADSADPPRSDGVDWAEELWGDENSGADPDFDPQLRADIWEETDHIADPAPEDVPEDAPERTAAEEPVESLFRPSDTAEEAAGDIIDANDSAPHEQEDTHDISEDGSDTDTKDQAPLSFIRSTRSVIDYEPEEGNIAVPDEEPPVATLELAEARAAQMAVAGVLSEHSDDPEGGAAEANAEPAVAGVSDESEPGDEQAALADRPDTPNSTAGDTPDAAPDLQDDAQETATVEDLGESPFSFPDDDVSFVDEDALREIISDVVREELQGEMGKRITRNIRKLVRREIRIALATDEIDD